MDGEYYVLGLIDAFYNELYGLTIGKFYSTTQLAYYNKANQIPKMLMSNIDGSISTVMLPALANEQDNKENVKRMMRKSIKTSAFLLFPVMFGLAAVSESLVKILLTEKWLPAVPLMQLLCFSYALWPIHSINLQAISAMGRSDIFLNLEMIKKTIGFVFLLISIPMGIKAMVIIQLIVSIISAFVNSYPNKKLINYSFIEQLKDISPYCVASIIMYIAVWMLNFITMSSAVKMIIQILLGVVIYMFFQIVFKTEEYIYAINYLKKKGEKK